MSTNTLERNVAFSFRNAAFSASKTPKRAVRSFNRSIND
jgi:hypothetical protein